jgi:uncharacterized protein
MPAHALVAVPKLSARVTDQTGTLSSEQRQHLEQRLAAFETAKGAQVALLIVPTTEPEAIEQYSIRVVEAWKLGRGPVDDGVLLLVAKDDRALRIEVGYGLEGALPDAIAKRIIEETIVPRFRQGDFFGGVQAGLEQIMKVIEGEPLPPPPARGPRMKGVSPDLLFLAIFVVLALGSALRSIFGRLLGSSVGGVLAASIAWWVWPLIPLALGVAVIAFLMILLGNNRSGRGSGYRGGGFSSGGFRGGGFGGGGFSGGGGGFGGGGASGRW